MAGRYEVRIQKDSHELMATIDDFDALDIRVGIITEVQSFPEARKPAYKLLIDFGTDIGSKRSSAQITTLYTPDDLIGKQILAVVNFPPRQIGPFVSEVLTLGVADDEGRIVLVAPDMKSPLGAKLC